MRNGLVIVGYGGMGEWHGYHLMTKVPEVNLKGAYDIREERMEVARKNGIHTYSSYEEVLSDPEVSIVIIATPNNFHKPLAEQAMLSGKDVILEKPATMNAEDFAQLMELSKVTGRLLTSHQNRRWDADYNIVKKIYRERLLGDVYMLENRVQGSRQVLNGWRGVKENGGGMVYDWGVHLIDQYLDMIDSPVTEVYANLFSLYTEEVDDNFKAILRFENKVSALIEVSMNCFILHPRWHVSAENGTAIINDWDLNGKMVALSDDKELVWDEKIVYTSAGPTRSMAPRPPETTTEKPLPQVQVDSADFYRNVLKASNGQEELVVKPEQTLRVLKVMDAIFQSDQLGQSIRCRI